jgi:hypothetical protein
MTKTLLASSILLGLLCGPALADTNYEVDIAMQKGNTTQKYALLIVENSCGDMSVKGPDHSAFFRVCLRSDAGKLKLELERKTRDGSDEVEVHAVVNATPKSTFTLTDMKVSLN